jgi:ribonuclease P protein component
VRVLVSVSKKRFHHAVKRNRVKRLVREAWRKNKAPLYEICQRDNISVDVALVYTATVIHSYEEMLAKTRKAVQEIIKKYESHRPTAR